MRTQPQDEHVIVSVHKPQFGDTIGVARNAARRGDLLEHDTEPVVARHLKAPGCFARCTKPDDPSGRFEVRRRPSDRIRQEVAQAVRVSQERQSSGYGRGQARSEERSASAEVGDRIRDNQAAEFDGHARQRVQQKFLQLRVRYDVACVASLSVVFLSAQIAGCTLQFVVCMEPAICTSPLAAQAVVVAAAAVGGAVLAVFTTLVQVWLVQMRRRHRSSTTRDSELPMLGAGSLVCAACRELQ